MGLLDFLKPGQSLGLLHHFVHSAEVLSQGLIVLSILELFQLAQLFTELLLDKDRNFFASVPIEDTEDANSVRKVCPGDVSILLGLSPALHAGCSPLDSVAVAVL